MSSLITLERITLSLQAHYHEVNTLYLCHKLTATTKLSDERAQHFVTECLEMRQKVTVALKRTDDITYDPNLK